MKITHFTELNVYQASRKLAHSIFLLSHQWPAEERFSLVDQIRRAARSVGANLAEAWGKRRYEAHFISKLSDADAENHEVEHWLICARDSGYITEKQFAELAMAKQETGRMLGAMLQNPDPFLIH
jgi:four helix bundle protein